jgi:hypothetical protein
MRLDAWSFGVCVLPLLDDLFLLSCIHVYTCTSTFYIYPLFSVFLFSCISSLYCLCFIGLFVFTQNELAFFWKRL